MIDILFVHPNASTKIYQDLSKNNSALEPPIWAGMLAKSVLNKGYSTEILDAEVLQLNYITAAQNIIEYKARIVCFVVYGQQPSASSQNMEGAIATANELRKNDESIFILFVGGHVSALPVETLKNELSLNAVCSNEGVYTIHSLLSIPNFEDTWLEKIDGLVFRNKNDHIIKNEPSKIVTKDKLEYDLPGIAWNLLPPLSSYRTSGWHSWSNNSEKSPFVSLYTSLGCPYKCSFCMINIINRTNLGDNITSADSNIYRYWSPDFIIQQFEFFALQGIRNIKIADELFVLNPNHFEKICDLIIERGYDFNIWAYARVDTCKPQYLKKLAKAGVKWLAIGIENPDPGIRKLISKDKFEEINIINVINNIRNEGINVAGNYIFGLPSDTEDTMRSTLDFALSNLTEMANFYTAMAYPGSPLYLNAQSKGLDLPKTYAGFSQHSYETLNLSNENLTSAQILKFRDQAWHEYHENQNYQNLLLNKFSQKAVDELNETLKIKLKRFIVD
jgi:anaerobic magnesium-protoporphyrin IX monomethyl ester cyclase